MEAEIEAASECAELKAVDDGLYLASINTNLAFEDNPILFRVELNVTLNDDGTGTANSIWRPIDLGGDEFSYPAEVGPDKVMDEGILEFFDRSVAANGTILLEFGRVIIPGPANTITGRPIDVELNLNGEMRGDGSICGVLAGDVYAPIMWDLTGSSLGLMPFPTETRSYTKEELLFRCQPCDGLSDDMDAVGENGGTGDGQEQPDAGGDSQ